MPYKDPDIKRAKQRERSRRRRAKRHIERYGMGAGNMSGKHGNQARGPRNGRWNHADRFITDDGYVAVRVAADHPRAWGRTNSQGQRYAYEHDLVAEEKIGRHLRDDELAHHRNGNRQDNAPNNILVETRSDHAREHGSAPGARDSLGRFAAGVKRLRERPVELRVRECPK
jgi:HNH endonuclease